MSTRERNLVAERLGTPDLTVGSVNNPVEYEEDGVHFNEKWTYQHLVTDPSGMPEREVYWHRYDLIATKVREGHEAPWRDDSSLAEDLKRLDPRLDPHLANPSITPEGNYRAVSDFKDKIDLGGYIQSEDELRRK